MNKRQQAVLDFVEAQGGRAWIEETCTWNHRGRPKWANTAMVTALRSMIPPVGRHEYTPGGFRREVVFRLIQEQEIKDQFYGDPNVAWVHRFRYLVERI